MRPIRSDTESPVGGAVVVLTYADVAEVHRELTATEAMNEQFAALVELSKDFIAIADLDGNVTFVNRPGRALVGLVTDEETLGRPTGGFFTDPGRDRSREIEESVRPLDYWESEAGAGLRSAGLRGGRGDVGAARPGGRAGLRLRAGLPCWLVRHPATR